MILLPGLPRRSPGLTNWSSVCMREEREVNTVNISTCSDEMEAC